MENETKMAGFLTTLQAGFQQMSVGLQCSERRDKGALQVLYTDQRNLHRDHQTLVKKNNWEREATGLYKLVVSKIPAFRCTFLLRHCTL